MFSHLVRIFGPNSSMGRVASPVFGVIVAILVDTEVTQGSAAPDQVFPSEYPSVLGFDFQDDAKPVASLVINRPDVSATPDVSIALPFKIERQTENEVGLFRYGLYQRWTMISYLGIGQNWPQQVSFVPIFDRTPDTTAGTTGLTGTLYLQAEGQIRHFLYRYPNTITSGPIAKIPQDLRVKNVDAIAITLPPGAREFAVRSGRLSIPDRLNPNDRVFPGVAPDAREPFLEIRYEVPPTDIQKLIVKSGVKFLAALVPVGGLLLAKKEHVKKPWVRNILVGVSLLLFLIILSLIIRTYMTTDEGGNEIIVDLILLVFSALISGAVIYTKGKSEDTDIEKPEI